MAHSDLPDAGRVPHSTIDAQIPTQGQKAALDGSLNTPNRSNRYVTQDDAPATPAASRIVRLGSNSICNLTAGGIRTITALDDISIPPTDAQLDTAFGEPATVGAGFIGLVNDNDAGTSCYLCISNGTNWFYRAYVKAV